MIIRPGLFKEVPLLMLFAFLVCSLQAQTNSLLWEVSGKGLAKPSYLYGTFHSKDSRAHQFGDSVMAKFQKADIVAVETTASPDNMGMDAVKMLMMKDTKLEDLINEEDFAFVKEKVREKLGIAGMLFNSMKPMLTSVMLLEVDAIDEMPEIVDDYFKLEAIKQNKKLVGLETMAEAMDAFDKTPLKEQAEWLVEQLRDEKAIAIFNEDLITAYSQQNLSELYSMYTSLKGAKMLKKELVQGRNQKFTERLIPLMEQGSVFCAVGALHLPGGTGLINALRRKGYKVEAIISQHTPIRLYIEDNREWFYYGDTIDYEMAFPFDPEGEALTYYDEYGDSTVVDRYTAWDSIYDIMYAFMVTDVKPGMSYEETVFHLAEDGDLKKVKEEKITYNNMPGVELEYNVSPGVNVRYIITDYEKKRYMVLVGGSKAKVYCNLAELFIENITFNFE